VTLVRISCVRGSWNVCRLCVFNQWVSDASRVVKETKFHTHFFGYTGLHKCLQSTLALNIKTFVFCANMRCEIVGICLFLGLLFKHGVKKQKS
jgi:hypothetical protein